MFDITLTEEEKKIFLTLSADSVEFNNLIQSIQDMSHQKALMELEAAYKLILVLNHQKTENKAWADKLAGSVQDLLLVIRSFNPLSNKTLH